MLFIEGKRSGYSVNQCDETMTVQEMIDYLQRRVAYGDLLPNEPIYLINDNGYTYGEINYYTMQRGYQEDSGKNHFSDDDDWDEWLNKINEESEE